MLFWGIHACKKGISTFVPSKYKEYQKYDLLTPSTTIDERKSTVRKLNKASKIFKTIVGSIQDKKGENIVSIDLRKIPEAVADYFILCEASSAPQVKAIADHVTEEVKKKLRERPYEKEGFSGLQWVILDYVNIVVHVFQPEIRQFYNLEGMWDEDLQQQHEA